MFKLELTDPTSYIQNELQRIIDLVAFGLHASDNIQIHSLDIPETIFQLTPSIGKRMEVQDARIIFKTWVLGNGLRDITDSIGPSLEWARKVCFIWTRQGQVSVNEDGSFHLNAEITGNEWNQILIKQGGKFNFFSLRDKLEYLHNEYDFTIPELAEDIISISKARNCLTHRGGVVNQEDVKGNSTNKLVVCWKKMQIKTSGEFGQRELVLPASVLAGEKISIYFSDTSKEFNLGESIQFTSEEFVQIATTCFLFALQIQKSIQQLQASKITPN